MSAPIQSELPFDSDFAERYERTRVLRYRPLVKKLLQLYDTRPYSRVLDAGTATGLVATMVAPRVGHGGHVIGIDSSEEMLDNARHKAKGFGFTQCEFRKGDITALDFAGGTFDLCVCSFSPRGEVVPLFTELFRVLKTDGTLLFQNFIGASPIDETTSDWFAHVSSGLTDAQLAEKIDEQAKAWSALASPQDYKQALEQVGFRSIKPRVEKMTVHFDTLADCVEWERSDPNYALWLSELPADKQSEFDATAVQALSPFAKANGFELELNVIQIRANK